MLDNHHIIDFAIFHSSFESFNYLEHRDKQVIRQCIQNFSTVIELTRLHGEIPKVLETGAGLSTIIFSKLLALKDERIKTIDVFAHDAINVNSRRVSDSFKLSELQNCEVIQGITIDQNELVEFYQSPESTLLSLSHSSLVKHLDLFLNFGMDDRKYQKVALLLSQTSVTAEGLKNYLKKNDFFASELFQSFRTEQDEFYFLRHNTGLPKLREILQQYQPNIIYLDSGEYSSNIEFNIIDQFSRKGTTLIVQDIFFPKSIKSFLIGSAILSSNRWHTLWVDKTTPQGMLICKKK